MRDRLSGRVDLEHVTTGRALVLDEEEEARLFELVKVMKSYGFTYTHQEVVEIARDYCVQLGNRTHNEPLNLKWF